MISVQLITTCYQKHAEFAFQEQGQISTCAGRCFSASAVYAAFPALQRGYGCAEGSGRMHKVWRMAWLHVLVFRY